MLVARIKKAQVIILGLFIYLAVIAVNDGFMALDEYWVGITRYIPAQSSSLGTLVAFDDVKSPLQLLPMHLVAQAALAVGVTSPYWQYRSVIFILGFFCSLMLFFTFFYFSKFEKLNEQQSNFLLFMLIFYFGSAFALTRPMFESLAAPWLTLAAVLSLQYDLEGKLKHLLWGVFFVSVAFVLRQQLGFCGLVFLILPILKKNLKHLLYAGALGLVFFLLAGVPDYFLRGQFHFSLLNLTLYNFAHGSDYGNRSVAFYPLLIVILTFLPFFVTRYPQGFIKAQFLKYRSLLIVLGLFIFLHSLFPQKWERFVISVIPLLLLLLFPFLYYLHLEFKQNRVRLFLLYSLNGVLFCIASFFPAQKNLIEMSLYLGRHPEIQKVYRVDRVPEWITEVFILKKNFQFVDQSREELKAVDWSDCSRMLVLSPPQEADLADLITGLKAKASFNVNLIEQLAYKANPKNNIRRVKLTLYSGCL